MEASQTPKAAIKVSILQKGLEAWIRIVPPIPVPIEELRVALQQNGVIAGIDEAALQLLSTDPPLDGALVARGTPPELGKPSRLEYFFSADPINVGPVENADGRVDYREGRVIQNVVEGQVLARKVPGLPGNPGLAVTGQPIPVPPMRDIHLLAGKNVQLSPDKLAAIATTTGIPSLEKNRVSVRPVFMVDEVDFSVGNINFQGSVIVKGNINPGFIVRATEGIEISGNVEGGILEAGGPITIKGGVRNASQVEAQGDLSVRFVDSESVLTSHRDILVQYDALNSTLTAGRSVMVGGHLIGGVTKSCETVQAGSLGNNWETATRVVINQERPDNKVDQLRAELLQLEIDYEEVSAMIKVVMTNPPQDGPFSLQKLMPQKVNMSLKLAQTRQQIAELENEQEVLPPPKIVVKGDIHPGVALTLNRKHLRIEKALYAKIFTLVDGEIHC